MPAKTLLCGAYCVHLFLVFCRLRVQVNLPLFKGLIFNYSLLPTCAKDVCAVGLSYF